MWGNGANMTDAREVKMEIREDNVHWLPECCQSIRDRGRSRVWGRKLNCSRYVGFKMPLAAQDGSVK